MIHCRLARQLIYMIMCILSKTLKGCEMTSTCFCNPFVAQANRYGRLKFALALAAAFCVFSTLNAADWRQFRGPYRDGVSKHSEHPIEWSETKNVAWKKKIEGVAWSQPIIVNGEVFVTTAVTENQSKPKAGEKGPGFSLFSAEGISRSFLGGGTPPDDVYQWKLICIDLKTGDRKWEKVVREAKPTIPIHRSNSYASETPICDSRQIYVYIAMAGLYCFGMEGNEVWNLPLKAHSIQYGWGTGGSATLFCNTLYIQCDNEKDSFVAAINRHDGKEIWRVQRDELSNWSTPYLWDNNDQRQLVTCGGKRVRSYALKDGELLWELPADGRCATSAVGDRRMLYVGSVSRSMGSSGSLTAVRSGARGLLSTKDLSDESPVAWSVRRGAPELSSPLLYKNKLYTFSQHGGIVGCFDAKTGKRLFRERLPGAGGFTSSPWAAKDKVFCTDENGRTFVMSATESKLDVVATNRLDGMFWSSPAIADNSLLLRSAEYLYRIAAPESGTN